MARDDPARYLLSPAAEADLADIWRYTSATWSADQADRYIDGLEAAFDTLASMPEIARERPEFDPPVRIHPSAQQVIVYRAEDDRTAILRVLGGRQNWRAILKLAE